MRIDRIFSEGEAAHALRRLGFEVAPAPGRPGLYDVAHPVIGGTRVFTTEQLCDFAAGATVIESHLKGQPDALMV